MEQIRNANRGCLVTLVRGPLISSQGSFNNEPVPPLGLAFLAGSLKQDGFEVYGIDSEGSALDRTASIPGSRLQYNGLSIDEIIERVPPRVRVIGISATFSHSWTQDKRLITRLKEAFPGALTIAGGEHITALPEYALRDCPGLDYCGLGEGEATMLEFCRRVARGESLKGLPGLSYIEEGRFVKTELRARLKELDAIPWPDWDVFPIKPYLDSAISFGASLGRNMPILASRGCPYECTFCSSPGMWTTRYQIRSPANVIKEIKGYRARYGITGLQFYDLTAIIHKKWTIEFCARLLDEKIAVDWSLPSGTRSEALDEESLSLLARSGCRYLVYAPESGSPNTLRLIKKKISLERLTGSVKAALAEGISVRTNMILGFPHETRRDILATLALQLRFALMGVEDCPLYPFQPYPGSELFNSLNASGKITLGDRYFEALATLSTGKLMPPDESYCEHIGRFELHFYRVTCFFLFYLLSYLLRPFRLLRTLKSLFTNRSSSVLEQRLKDRLRRVRRGLIAKGAEVLP